MKDWNIVLTERWLCPFRATGVTHIYCTHPKRENKRGCTKDLCPIKQPPNKVDSVCACGHCNTTAKDFGFRYCPYCGNKLEQD